jgi:hypothetical protein
MAGRLGRPLRAEACFVLLRLVVRRQIGGIGITDILVIVLIAEV